jgi:Flp pilus assembly protein TadG
MSNGAMFDQLALVRLKSAAVERIIQRVIAPVFAVPLARRFAEHNEANSTIEFGLLAAPFVVGLFAILQTALVFFAGQTLETAAAASARLIFTGQAQLNGWTAAQFKTQVCDQIHGIFNCSSGVYVDVETYSSFAAVNLGVPISNGSFNSSSLGYNPGGPGDIVVLRLYYQYPVFVNLLGFNLSNLNGGLDLLTATAVFKNEPYASSSSSSS